MEQLTSNEILSYFAAITAIAAAVSTVVYTIITMLLLRKSAKSIELTYRAIFLSVLMHEADLVLRQNEKNPDGSLRFGAERASSRQALEEYIGELHDMRVELEEQMPSLRRKPPVQT